MMRAVHSVHSNIAEGSGRLSLGEWQQFLGQARGSLLELESQVIAAFDLEYLSLQEAADMTERIRGVTRVINGLLNATRKGFKVKKYKPEPVQPPDR